MPVEALVPEEKALHSEECEVASQSEKHTGRSQTVKTKGATSLCNEENTKKITNYFLPSKLNGLSNGCHLESEMYLTADSNGFNNHDGDMVNGHTSNGAICTRSRSLQRSNPNEIVNGVSFDRKVCQTPSPPKREFSTPEGSPRSGPTTPHKIQALNEQKLKINVKKSPPKLPTPKVKYITKITKTKKPKLPKSTVTVKKETEKGASNGVQSETKTKNSIITDFFPIRRSHRKPQTTLMQEKQKEIEERILCNNEDGLKIQDFQGKGRGIVATRHFKKGDMVVEYIGDLIDTKEAKDRDQKYAKDTSKGCYMYYFTHQNTQYCIDATEESGYLGRLVNHSRASSNLVTKTVEVKGKPHLILIAKKDIEPGTEVLYDYGDRSKQSLEHHPWLAL